MRLISSISMQISVASIPLCDWGCCPQLFSDPAEREACEQLLERQEEVEHITALLRLLQLFCEGHHIQFQNYVRFQDASLHSHNMVSEVWGPPPGRSRAGGGTLGGPGFQLQSGFPQTVCCQCCLVMPSEYGHVTVQTQRNQTCRFKDTDFCDTWLPAKTVSLEIIPPFWTKGQSPI